MKEKAAPLPASTIRLAQAFVLAGVGYAVVEAAWHIANHAWSEVLINAGLGLGLLAGAICPQLLSGSFPFTREFVERLPLAPKLLTLAGGAIAVAGFILRSRS